MSFFQHEKNGLLVHLLVSPKASKTQALEVTPEGRLKLKVCAPPLEGQANEACRVWLSKTLKCPKSLIDLVRGDKSKEKTFYLATYDPALLQALLHEIQP